jgi:hypothetical protein
MPRTGKFHLPYFEKFPAPYALSCANQRKFADAGSIPRFSTVVSVRTDDAQDWKISPTLLRKIPGSIRVELR